eukprot:CAMPEP_0184872544 /NCGR_PEP_ID=MMETSP0580-20130426/41349_1 /TAXON_ID=1118495 /ORGANISM="Dactyliosolen fragilissimus" /LENGTH=181 /DNA_ID=CAMNT_0027375361 /DNA_START=457 /DNA_END=999 /DNA_ORIENTATION=-
MSNAPVYVKGKTKSLKMTVLRAASSAAIYLLVVLNISISLLHKFASSYPIITELEPGVGKCFHFSIPDNDDMHMVFVAFPSVDASSLSEESLDLTEDWYVNEISEMTRHESTKFMKEILLTPDVRRLVPRQESKFHVRIIKPYGTPFTKHEVLTFYEPLTLKNIVSEAREDYVNKFEGKKW